METKPNNIIQSTFTTEELHKAIAIEIMEEMYKGKDVSSILAREKILEILQKIKEKGAGYYLVHQDFNNANKASIDSFAENKDMLFKSLLKEIANEIQFDIEFYKFGRSFNSLRKRWAIITREELYSATEPLTSHPNRLKAKKKTQFLYNATVTCESKSQMVPGNKMEWSVAKKPHRLRIEFDDNSKKNKKNYFFLYLENEKQMEQVCEMLFVIRSKSTDKANAIVNNLKLMQKVIESSYLFYGVYKLIEVKQQIKRKKILLNSLRATSNVSVNYMAEFGRTVARSIVKSFKIERSKLLQNQVQITRFPKYKFLITNLYSKPKDSFTPFVSMTDLKENVNKISNCFPEIFRGGKSINKHPGSQAARDDLAVMFKLADATTVENYPGTPPPMDPEKVKKSRGLLLNKISPEIKFSDDCALNKNHILNISNVLLNCNPNCTQANEDQLVILGPKINNGTYLKYSPRVGQCGHGEKMIEPEGKALSINTGESKVNVFKSLFIQIFHAIFIFERRDMDMLETHQNIDGLNKQLKFTNPMTDFYFFLTMTIDKSHKVRSKLFPPAKYENNTLIIEFNLEYLLNLSNLEQFKNLEILFTLHLIPTQSFDIKITEQERNFYVDYLKSYDMGYCAISPKSENGTCEFKFVKDGITLPDDDKILIHFIEEDTKPSELVTTKFTGKDFSIGGDFYVMEDLDKGFFEGKMQDKKIDPEVKEKYFNVKFSTDGCILLRPDERMKEEDFIKALMSSKKPMINSEDLKNILYNRRYKFLPMCEIYESPQKLENSRNLNSNSFEIAQRNLQPGEWIYKLKKIYKDFLCNFKGITENSSEIYYINYFKNECRCLELNKDNMKFIRQIQEDTFNVLNYQKIDPFSVENSRNYQWKVGMKFTDPREMVAFVSFLKFLRRKAHMMDMKERNMLTSPISQNKLLSSMMQNIKQNVRLCKILIDKIEFRQSFHLVDDRKILFRLKKNSSVVLSNKNEKLSRSMLEALDESEAYGYKNKIAENPEVKADINLLKSMKNAFKDLPREYGIKSAVFNKSHKIILFSDKLSQEDRLLEMECKPSLDKNFLIEILLKKEDHKGMIAGKDYDSINIILGANVNLESLINFKPSADYIILPVFHDNAIVAILHIRAWCVPTVGDGRNIQFDDEYNKNIRKTIASFVPKDAYGNDISLGTYEPNVFKRKVMQRLRDLLKMGIDGIIEEIGGNDEKSVREQTYAYLSKKCIKYCQDLVTNNVKNFRWTELVCNLNLNQDDLNDHMMMINSSYVPNAVISTKFKFIRKYEMNRKRNEFYREFAYSEWMNFFRKIYGKINKDSKILFEDIKMYSILPNNSELVSWKMSNNALYQELRYLIQLGIPQKERLEIWERLLEVEKLFSLTKKQGKSKFEDEKMITRESVYLYFKDIVQKNIANNINFSMIDNDSNFMTSIDPKSNFYSDLANVKMIAKAYFLWTEMNIRSMTIDDETKYVYFFGMLKLIQRLYSVLKSEYKTFWLIIGLSQVIDLFHQKNPLYNSEISYANMYVLITKLIMESHLQPIFSKFIQLGFPVEFFICKQIPTLFSDYFQTELFLRIFDIFIFEAAIKASNYDQYSYLRVICTIPLTLLKLNERALLQCQSVSELEATFGDMVRKSYNNTKFIENVVENITLFYSRESFIEKYLNLNKNISWDYVRSKVVRSLWEFFGNVEYENKTYLKKLAEALTSTLSAPSSLGINFIKNYEEEAKGQLSKVRKIYAEGTPNFTGSIMINEVKKFGIIYQISRIFCYTRPNNLPEQMQVYIEYSNVITPAQDFDRSQNRPITIVKDKDRMFAINMKTLEAKFDTNFPKYINIFLFDLQMNFISSFSVNILKLDIMKPLKCIVESHDSVNKTVIEIGLFKFSLESVSRDDCDLFNLVFSEPGHMYDSDLERELNGREIPSKNLIDGINKLNMQRIEECLKNVKSAYNIDETNKFTLEELKRNGLPNYTKEKVLSTNVQNQYSNRISENIEGMLKSLITNETAQKVILDWLKNTDTSFEEILYSLILIDQDSVTIYDKLLLLYNIAKMKNYVLFNSDFLQVDKLKELVYALYKRYMVYFTKYDVERMVDYVLKKENLLNVKYAFIYNSANHEDIEKVIYDKDRYKIARYDDIGKEIAMIVNYLKNNFKMNSISPSLMLTILNSIVHNNPVYVKKGYNTIRIEMINDSITTSRIYAIVFKNGNLNVCDLDENNKIGMNSNNPFEHLLSNELNSLEMYNTYAEGSEISFDKFKDVFFALPFIPDLLRASCGFVASMKDNFIVEYSCVKVEVSVPGQYVLRNFYFGNNIDPSIVRASNQQMSMIIPYPVSSATSMQDLRDMISLSLLQDSERNIRSSDMNNELRTIIENPKLLGFYVLNKGTLLEEKMKFFDSFYSSSFIRNSDPNKPVDILFKIEAWEEMSRVEKQIILKKPGYAKLFVNFPNYEYRQCKIHQGQGKFSNSLSVKFKTFHYPCKII